MNKQMIVRTAYDEFKSFVRPEHFTNHTCCEECAEHDETMRSCDMEALGPDEVGQPCWTPLPLLTEEALGHVMPRLIELALNESLNKDGDTFVFDFLLVLIPSSGYSKFSRYKKKQVACVCAALGYIKDNLWGHCVDNCFEDTLIEAVAFWHGLYGAPPATSLPLPESKP